MSPDDGTYARWLESLRPQLIRYARERLGGDLAEAEDVVQDASMRALVALRQGRVPENPRAWMFVIVRNRCHDVRGARRPSVPLDEAFDVRSSAAAPVDAVAARGELEAVVDAIGSLPESQRRALVGATFEGRPYEEIAARERVSVQAVKSLVHRARRGLEAAGARAAALLPPWVVDLREVVAGHGAASAAAVAVAVPVAVAPALPDLGKTASEKGSRAAPARVVSARPAATPTPAASPAARAALAAVRACRVRGASEYARPCGR